VKTFKAAQVAFLFYGLFSEDFYGIDKNGLIVAFPPKKIFSLFSSMS
jgi:hypothetical protein